MIDFKQKIAEQISKTTNIPQEQIIEYIEIPADEKMGDFSFPCFATSYCPIPLEYGLKSINNFLTKIELKILWFEKNKNK